MIEARDLAADARLAAARKIPLLLFSGSRATTPKARCSAGAADIWRKNRLL
jgi:hypothetical protein